MQDTWMHGMVSGQASNDTFMTLQSADGTEVVGVTAPVAGTAEIHEMEMRGDMMHICVVPSLGLPKDQVVQLEPGGYHVIFMDLKQPLVKDTTVPLTLRVELADKHVVKQRVEAHVRDLTAGNMPAMNHGGKHKH